MKEEEAARAKEEMRKRMLKERRDQEEKYSRVNRMKIMNQWRKLMRLVKVEDLRKEIEIISQNHEREVDRKDAIIQARRATGEGRGRGKGRPAWAWGAGGAHTEARRLCGPELPPARRRARAPRALRRGAGRRRPAQPRAPSCALLCRCSTATSRTVRSNTRWRCGRTCSSWTG